MIPWQVVDRASTPGGGQLVLARRGDEFAIRVDGADLMNSRVHASEDALGALGCAGLGARRGAKVLIGGLGMGFTARAALDALAGDARVDVVELVPAVVRWNREHLGHLARHALDDRRLRVIEGDATAVIARAESAYDAILMDVDNGPEALTAATNASLYGAAGLARAHRALRPDGCFAVWSAFDAHGFTRRLRAAGFEPRVEHVRAHAGGGSRHLVWVARAVTPRPARLGRDGADRDDAKVRDRARRRRS